MGDSNHRLDPADRAEIVELLARYAELIDAGDFDGVGDLLSDATLVDPNDNAFATGAEAIAALYPVTTKLHEDGTPRTTHIITNAIVDPLDDGVVEMRSRFVVLQATGDLPLQPVVVGRYVDRVERIEGRWRFVRRQMIPQFWGDVSAHLTFDPRG